MAQFTSFNNSLVVSQSEFKWEKYTDANSLYSWFKKDSFTTYKGMLSLWNQRKIMNTPLLNMTELQDNVVYVNGAEGQFEYDIPYELALPYIVENMVSGIAQPGIDGQKFKIKLSENCYTNTDRITYDYRDGVELFITEEEIYPEGEGWVYTVQVVSFDRKHSFFPPEFLAPATQFMKVSNSNGEYSTQKSTVSTRMGTIRLQNQLAGHRSIYHWITGYADLLEVVDSKLMNISRQYNDLTSNKSTMLMYNVDDKRQPIKGSLTWMTMVDALCWGEMGKMEENDLMWSKGGIVEGSGRTPVRVGMGLYEQMRNGNRIKYTTLTKGLLDSIFGQLFYNSGIPIEDRHVEVQVGTAASIELSALFENEFGKTPFLVNASDIGLLKGDSQHLGFGYRFTSMQFPSAGVVEFKINPAFDNVYSRAMDGLVGEYPIFSHTIAIFDVTDGRATNAAAKMASQATFENGFNEGSNISLVKPKRMTGTVWGYEVGTQPPPGMSGQGMIASGQRDGYAIWMKNISSIWLKDATRSVLLEKNRVVS